MTDGCSPAYRRAPGLSPRNRSCKSGRTPSRSAVLLMMHGKPARTHGTSSKAGQCDCYSTIVRGAKLSIPAPWSLAPFLLKGFYKWGTMPYRSAMMSMMYMKVERMHLRRVKTHIISSEVGECRHGHHGCTCVASQATYDFGQLDGLWRYFYGSSGRRSERCMDYRQRRL